MDQRKFTREGREINRDDVSREEDDEGRERTSRPAPQEYGERRDMRNTVATMAPGFRYPITESQPRPRYSTTPPIPPTYYSNAYPGQFSNPMGGGPMMYFQNPIMDFAYWAPYPEDVPPGIPPGLAHLIAVDTILVMQQVNMMELFMSVEQPCTFMVLNSDGLCIFYAYESSNMLARHCCGDSRPLQLHLHDMYQNEMIYMSRKCACTKCQCCYRCCCLTAMEVYSVPLMPIGAIIGHSQPGSILLDIVDVDENVLFHVHQGNGCLCIYCLMDMEFTITTPDIRETEVGMIRKQWGGAFREYLSSADVFTVNFPKDMDVRIKALFIAAMFLINYMYYE